MLQEKSFRAGTVMINYAEGPPSGPPLVLLHGINNRWQAFLPLIPALAMRWHIYALDFRGHGKSDRAPGRYQAQDYVSDTGAFLRDHVQEPAILFGHSLGGVIALWVAARIPDAVKALVLGDNVIFLDSLQESPYVGSLFVGLRDLLQQGRSVEELAAALAAIPAPLPGRETSVCWGEHPGMDAAFLRYLAKSYSQSDPEVLTMVLDGRVAEGYEPEKLLRQILCPVLLLQANPALGATMSDKDVSRALALLVHATHVRFEQLGHFLHLEQVGPVLRAVTTFLESL